VLRVAFGPLLRNVLIGFADQSEIVRGYQSTRHYVRSSAGRARPSEGRGRWFEPTRTCQTKITHEAAKKGGHPCSPTTAMYCN
jgi:hypothetical protein